VLTPVVNIPFSICRLVPDDVAAVMDLAARSPEAARWSRGDFERACGGDLDGWVAIVRRDAQSGSRRDVVGFLVARRMADEMEILNVAVDAAFRRRGLATGLLAAALALGRASGAKRAFLEVRASNAGAIAFYERLGFASAGRRPRYYSDPPEDALVLVRALA
jgi:ribosomal-protein-alanine N-acetyltransferase